MSRTIIIVFISLLGTTLASLNDLADIAPISISLVYTPDRQIHQFIHEQLLPNFAQNPSAELDLSNHLTVTLPVYTTKFLLLQDPRKRLIDAYKTSPYNDRFRDIRRFLEDNYRTTGTYAHMLSTTGDINDALIALERFDIIGTVKHLDQFADNFYERTQLTPTKPVQCDNQQQIDEYEYNWDAVESFIMELTRDDYIIYNRAMELSQVNQTMPVCNYDLSDYPNIKSLYNTLAKINDFNRFDIKR